MDQTNWPLNWREIPVDRFDVDGSIKHPLQYESGPDALHEVGAELHAMCEVEDLQPVATTLSVT